MPLVTVTIVSTTSVVSTPIGRMSPGDTPISQIVRVDRMEKMAADLMNLEAQGLITYVVSDDTTNDDRMDFLGRGSQSNSNGGGSGGAATGTEYQGQDLTFYVPLPTTGAGAAVDIVVIAPGVLNGKQLRVLDCMVSTTTGQASGALVLRDTAAGGGAALSSSMAMTAAGITRNNLSTALGLTTKAKGLFARKAIGNAVGELVIWARVEY